MPFRYARAGNHKPPLDPIILDPEQQALQEQARRAGLRAHGLTERYAPEELRRRQRESERRSRAKRREEEANT
jgi:hypothetical protein